MKPGRNDPCPCGSGKKYKQCHGKLEAHPALQPMQQQAQTATHSMNEALKILASSIDPYTQKEAVRAIKDNVDNYQPTLLRALMINPFLVLPPEDQSDLLGYSESCGMESNSAQAKLLMLRQLSSGVSGRRCCIFCMPKSGSSFVQSAIQSALNVPFVMLTNYSDGPSTTSYFGMNGRMQELDELAIISNIFASAGNFVAQHHTKCTPFLASQLKFFKIRPIVTVRNIYDCIISADDMYIEWRTQSDWVGDGPFGALPAEFSSTPKGKRLELLSYNLGTWLIDFYLSWKRCEGKGVVSPLWVVYEHDIIGQRGLGAKLGSYMGMDNAEREKLRTYIESPDKIRSRFNKGISGRGVGIPEHARLFLKSYASNFRSELNDEDLMVLFGGRIES